MPFAIAAAGSAIGALASAYGASKQADAVNGATKSAARIAEENRVIGQANLTNTLNTVGPRLEQAGTNASDYLTGANGTATNALNAGYGLAGQRLTQGGAEAAAYLNTGRDTIGAGVQNANALLQPYIDTGGRALGMVGDLSGANGVDAGRAAMQNFQFSPAYQFNLEQGLRGVDAGAAARGMLTSGGTMAGEMKFASGLASNEFTNYYNRLQGLAGQGLNASNAAGGNIINGAGAQAGLDTGLANNARTTGAGLAALDTGLAGGLSGNAMATGKALAANTQTTGTNISNLYTGNAQQQVRLGTDTADAQAQTATSGATAMANIYGGAAQGVGNAINSGMNNYMKLNALAPTTPQTAAVNAAYPGGNYYGYTNPTMTSADYAYMKAG